MRYEDDDAVWTMADTVESELEGFRDQLAREREYYEAAQDAGDWRLAFDLQAHVRWLESLVDAREAEWALLVAHGDRRMTFAD